MAFSFGFSGDDIEESQEKESHNAPEPTRSAFPVPGKPQLVPQLHNIKDLLQRLPSKIAYDTVDVPLDDGTRIQVTRRELWDVRVQLMAEEDIGEEGEAAGDFLGAHDVKTGIYEGGFKSWESSVDLVKVLAANSHPATLQDQSVRIIELGCGTALPSLALFQWSMALESSPRQPYSFILADYNPSVLHLVTLPNFLLAWALKNRHTIPALSGAFMLEGELELDQDILQAFEDSLAENMTSLSFISGGWSPEFIDRIYTVPTTSSNASNVANAPVTMILGAETIYSPFALESFAETTSNLLKREAAAFSGQPAAWVAAKRLYFGVGGSLDVFVSNMQGRGAVVSRLRDEEEGVRRGVVHCMLPSSRRTDS